MLASTGSDKTVKFWDTRRGGNAVSSIKTIGENINLAWKPDGTQIVVGDKDDRLTIIDTRKNNKAINTSKFPFEVNEFFFSNNTSPDAQQYLLAAVGLSDGTGAVKIFDYASLLPSSSSSSSNDTSNGSANGKRRKERTIVAHSAPVYSLAYNPHTSILATGSADALVGLWDANEFVCVQTIERMSQLSKFLYDSICIFYMILSAD
jgi:THO complex subunit 3